MVFVRAQSTIRADEALSAQVRMNFRPRNSATS